MWIYSTLSCYFFTTEIQINQRYPRDLNETFDNFYYKFDNIFVLKNNLSLSI